MPPNCSWTAPSRATIVSRCGPNSWRSRTLGQCARSGPLNNWRPPLAWSACSNSRPSIQRWARKNLAPTRRTAGVDVNRPLRIAAVDVAVGRIVTVHRTAGTGGEELFSRDAESPDSAPFHGVEAIRERLEELPVSCGKAVSKDSCSIAVACSLWRSTSSFRTFATRSASASIAAACLPKRDMISYCCFCARPISWAIWLNASSSSLGLSANRRIGLGWKGVAGFPL